MAIALLAVTVHLYYILLPFLSPSGMPCSTLKMIRRQKKEKGGWLVHRWHNSRKTADFKRAKVTSPWKQRVHNIMQISAS